MQIARFLVLYGLVVSMTGCLGPKKVNKWVKKHYEQSPAAASASASAKPNDVIAISSPLVPASDRLSETESRTTHLLPLLFYWKWDYQNTCALSTHIAVSNATNAMTAYAGKKGLKQKLHGQRLQLSIDQVPNSFIVDDKGWAVWVILYVFGSETLSIQPLQKDLVVSYKLLGADGTEVKSGLVTIADHDRGITLKMFQSLKKKTWQYLEQYDEMVAGMGRAAVDKLMAEL